MSKLDPRITPARPDLAAAQLKGKVEAARYVDGVAHVIARGRIALHAQPSTDAPLETELLFGQTFVVYEHRNGWAWGQAAVDNCVGYVHTIACSQEPSKPSHRVRALATPLLPAPDAKRPARDLLPMNACVEVHGTEKGFARVGSLGFVFEGHLRPLAHIETDWVAVAERFVGTPYVWGGRTHAGLDCSGLLQTSLEAAGRIVPRDTDLQEEAVGQAVDVLPELSNLQRGDLVFWNGHVGIMVDPVQLLHATSFNMQVAIENLREVVRRNEAASGPITSIKRL
jgi:cell wall-associated NlpC family hydrolase